MTNQPSPARKSDARRKALPRPAKKLLDCVHLTAAALWLGAFALSALFVASTGSGFMGLSAPDAAAAAQGIRDTLIKPLIPLVMATGIIYGAGTKWGFTKVPWVRAKWLLSIALVASIPLLPQSISSLCLQLVLVVALFALSVWKPAAKRKA